MTETDPAKVRLSGTEVEQRLTSLPGWSLKGESLERTFERGDFAGSLAFVNAVAGVANELDHHPDIAISWGTVTLTLSSHDVGGLSQRDFTLAERIDALG
jgi:4a-hydroxytetrahydrobiopterin dehydratase